MRYALVLVGSAAVLAACGAYSFPGASPAASGSVSGHVISVPCAPVEPAGSACAGRPVGGLQIVFQNGSESRIATTDRTGSYATALPAGTWTVALKTYMRVISGPSSVTVRSDSPVVANYVLDSGIRVPLPQQ